MWRPLSLFLPSAWLHICWEVRPFRRGHWMHQFNCIEGCGWAGSQRCKEYKNGNFPSVGLKSNGCSCIRVLMAFSYTRNPLLKYKYRFGSFTYFSSCILHLWNLLWTFVWIESDISHICHVVFSWNNVAIILISVTQWEVSKQPLCCSWTMLVSLCQQSPICQ